MSLGDGEFRFWTEPTLRYHVRSLDVGLHGSMDPWRAADEDYSSSPLLPCDHQYSSPSPSWRSRAIEQGRRELMEMVGAMPDSSFELSLKDIVDEQQNWTESRKEEGSVSREVDKEEKQKSCKKRKKASSAGLVRKADRRQVSRTSSMEGGTFMIKLFFPAFLTTKKKASSKGRNQSKSKVSPRTSTDRTENREECKSWENKSSAATEQRNLQKHSGSKSCRSKRSSSCRGCHGESVPGCWPFEMMKGKLRRQRTCNF